MTAPRKLPSLRRIVFYLAGVIFMTFGIALVIKANSGVAPVNTISYAVYLLTELTVGTCATLFYVLCLLMQLMITRRITLLLILQLPFSYIFGSLIDLFNWLLAIEPGSVWAKIAVVIAGSVCIAFGLRAIVGADIIMAPPDSFTKTAGAKLGLPMSKSKLAFDFTVTVTAALVMLVFRGAESVLSVVSFGTLISVLTIGPMIGVFTKLLPFLDTAAIESIAPELAEPGEAKPEEAESEECLPK